MKTITFHESAEREMRESLDYYESRRPGLGGDFRRELEHALDKVRENPLAFAVEDELGVRYCLLKRFPYMLVFIDLEDRIWVAAVAHCHRRPRYWSYRRPNN